MRRRTGRARVCKCCGGTDKSDAIGDGRDRVLARKTTGTPGRPAGAKTSAAPRSGETDREKSAPTPGEANSATPETTPGSGTAQGGVTPPKTMSAPETGKTATPAKEGDTPSAPRPASAAVDLGTTSRPAATTAGSMPAVTRSPRATDADKPTEETTGKATTAAEKAPKTGDPASVRTSEARDPATATPATPQTPAPPSRASGFGAGLLGGLIAAALGLGAGWIWLNNSQRGEELEARLATIEGEIAPLADGLDGLRAQSETGLSELGTRLDGVETGLIEMNTQIETLETRLTEAEASAGPDGTLAREAVARWQAEVDALRADLEAQAQEIAGMAEQAAQQVATAGRTAEQIEAEAAAVAARARARATLAEIEAALETGEPYPALIEELQATSPTEIPQGLSAPAAEGVASRAELIEAFPEPARAALARARREGLSGEEGGRVAGFFRDTLQLRSTAPVEGETTDAVLSRAEAALRDGRLQEALDEIAALPEPVREALSDWIAPARTRAEALAAADTLSQSLTEN